MLDIILNSIIILKITTLGLHYLFIIIFIYRISFKFYNNYKGHMDFFRNLFDPIAQKQKS